MGLATLVICCDKHTVEVKCDCRQYVWSPRLLQWLICELFANIDKLSTGTTGLKQALPSERDLVRNPMQTVWDVGAIVLGARGINQLQQEVHDLKARLGAVEKAQAPKGKSKDQ